MRGLGAVCTALPLVAAIACQLPGRSTPATTGGAGPHGVGAAVELRQAADRPAIGLVAREGDPQPAVALAVAHDFGAEASVALSELIAARLRKAGFSSPRARPHGLGFVVSSLVSSPEQAVRFVRAATDAIATPVTSSEVSALKTANRVPTWHGASESAVGSCSGELGVLRGDEGTVSVEPPDATALERWRGQSHTASAAAFAAVGSRTLLDAAAGAISEGPSWPSTPGPTDPWPSTDSVGMGRGEERRVSVALRIADASRAAEMARALGAPGSRLATRVAGLEPGWSVDRVVATSRLRGACLRVDIRATRAEPAPRLLDVATVATVVNEEMRPALAAGPASDWTLDDAVVRPADPRDAAATAAWRALSGRLASGPARRFLSYAAPAKQAPARADQELAKALAQVEQRFSKSTVVQRLGVESGQGELWALAASPCGTAAEGTENAGTAALLLRSLAARRSGQLGVSIEAWTTADGVGLVAHAPRLSPKESPSAHARRVGDALGRALVATRLVGTEVAEQRATLLGEIGPAHQRGLWLALDTASSGHPSWLDPRGTWDSVSAASTHELVASRRELLTGPLRLAVLSNASPSQGQSVASALELWLRPHRLDTHACPSAPRGVAKNGELALEVEDDAHESVYVAVPLPPSPGGPSRAAEWTAYLLNRPGGLLESALAKLGGGASARSTVLGGQHAAALVIELRVAEGDTAPVVAQVRGLLERLSSGAATEADAEAARRHFARLDAEAAVDPRRRLLDLWRGSTARTADLAQLHRLHRSLAPPSHVVVSAKLGK